jgi:hypothetical protein
LLPAAFRAPVPVEGAAFGWQLVLHAALAFHLLQVIPGRERLAWAALLTAVGVETAVTWVQGLYVLPAMAEATAHGDASVAAEGVASGDLSERIANGGWFGTFTLSNTLAAWLLLAAVPLCGLVVRSWAARFLLLAAAGVFLATRSKGAVLAVTAAGSCFWLVRGRGWWRWLPVPAMLAGLAVLALVPAVQDGLMASARVRLGYWQGAAALIQEAPWTGLGWGMFAERSSGVMALWAEPSRLVHNEPLEAAVVAGVPVGVLLLLLLLWLGRPWGRAPGDVPTVAASPSPNDWLNGLFLTGLVTYLSLLGMLEGNVGWWVGGGNLLGQCLWGWVIGVGMSVALMAFLRLPMPATWWFRCGLAALALHCLVDFNLHSFAVVGTLIVVASLAGGATRELPVARWVGGVALVLVFALGVGAFGWARQALEVRGAGDVVRLLRLTRDPAHAREGFQALAATLGQDEPHDRRSAQELTVRGVNQVLESAPADPGLVVQAAAFLPSGAERLALLDAWLPRLPSSTSLARLRAEDYEHRGSWAEAVAELRRAEGLAPAHQPIRQQLIALLQRAERGDPTHADQWRSEREAVERVLAEREPVVNYHNRSQ